MAVFAIAGKAEATRGAGRWSLDNEKSESACSALTGIRRSGEAACFQPHSQSGLHPEELVTELDSWVGL